MLETPRKQSSSQRAAGRPTPSPQRRATDKFLTPAALAAALLAATPAAAAVDWESTERIALAAERAVAEGRRLDPARSSVNAQTPDTRLRLARCDGALEARRVGATNNARRETVRVACSGTVRWKVYVPVTVASFEAVSVATRNLPKGHVLTADDLSTRRVDVATLPAGYLLDPAQAIGHVLTQSVARDSVLRPGQLKADDAIRRGQAVALLSGAGGVAIRMGGVALESAPRGGRITARNASSGAVVEGIVLNEKEIRVTGRR